MKSSLIFYLILVFLLFAVIFGQDITQTDPNKTVVAINFDDNTAEETISQNDTDTDAEDLTESEAVPSQTGTEHDLDQSLRGLIDSGNNFMQETKHIYKEELEGSHSDSEAKDVWIAYSKSWGRVFNALIKEVMSKVLSADDSIDLSLDCVASMLDVMTGLRRQKEWAVKLFDSSGRPFAAGSLDGTITSLGAYDQCLDIERQGLEDGAPDFVGQYCIMRYKLALPPKPSRVTLRSRVFNFSETSVSGTFLEDFSESAHVFYDRFGRTGLCIPSTCTQQDYEVLLKTFLSENQFRISINDCHTKTLPKLNSLQICIISLFTVLFCLMVLATSLDLIIAYTKDTEHHRFIRVESPIRKLFVATLLAFSVYTNGRNLFGDRGQPQSQIQCLNGIRVMSMLWILWTHTYLIPIKETFTFVKEFMYTVEELGFQLILNGWVLVDSFFVVGAMLTTYSNLHRMTNNNGQINILQQILNRFFRIWPSLCTTVLLIFLIPSMASGPLWKEYFNVQLDKCSKNWWSNIIFINNWWDESEMCLLHTWYLSADFQLFVIALFFIIFLYKKPSLGLKLIAGSIFASALAIAIRTYLLKQNPTVLYNTPNERDVYDQASTLYVHTYIHLGPYFVGLVLGYFVFKHRSLKINPLLNLFIWLCALFGCMVIMLATYTLNRGEIWRPVSGALYAGLHRTAWAVCISWIIFGCTSGNGGPINTFLSWNFFVPMGKLSFMIYLMHFLVIWVRYAYIRQPLPFSHYIMFCEFIVNLVVSTAVSVVTHLAVEAPLLTLYRIYLANAFKWMTITVRQGSDKKVDNNLNDSQITNIMSSKL